MTTRPHALWIVTLATLFAAVLRFVMLDSLAPAAWFDEVWFALRARELLQTGELHAFYTTYFGGANAGLVYLTALVQWLGIDTITSARWVLAAAGIISVPLAYQCMRALMGSVYVGARHASPLHKQNLVGILAAIFLSYTLFHVIITRVGMESGIAPAVAMFVIWQMLIGARSAKPTHWIAAGLALGLSQYNGLHARFILPVVAFLALDLLITSRHRGHVLRGLGIMLGAALIVMIPLILFFAQNPEWLTARAGVVVGSGWDRYWGNFTQIARVFFIEGSYDPKTTVPGVPLLDAIQTGGFLIGLIWVLLNLHRQRSARVLIVWLLVAMLPGILTDGPNLQRMINIAAPLAGITALGWVVIYDGIKAFSTRRHEGTEVNLFSSVPPRLRVSILCSLVAISALWNTHMLFVRWPQEPKLGAQFTAPPVDLARDAIDASAQMPIFAERAPEADDIIAWEFLFPNTPVTRLDLRQCLPLPHQRSTPTGYIVLTDRDAQTIDTLRDLYPQSYFRAREADLWQGDAAWLEIPAGAEFIGPHVRDGIEFASGIRFIGFDFSGLDGPMRAGDALSLTLYWHATEDGAADYTSFVHIGQEGQPPIAQWDGQPCNGLYPTSQWRAGEVITSQMSVTIPADAPEGDYAVLFGWYGFPSLERLPVLDQDEALPDHRVDLLTITVVSP